MNSYLMRLHTCEGAMNASFSHPLTITAEPYKLFHHTPHLSKFHHTDVQTASQGLSFSKS
jgi:hypothetical protein